MHWCEQKFEFCSTSWSHVSLSGSRFVDDDCSGRVQSELLQWVNFTVHDWCVPNAYCVERSTAPSVFSPVDTSFLSRLWERNRLERCTWVFDTILIKVFMTSLAWIFYAASIHLFGQSDVIWLLFLHLANVHNEEKFKSEHPTDMLSVWLASAIALECHQYFSAKTCTLVHEKSSTRVCRSKMAEVVSSFSDVPPK